MFEAQSKGATPSEFGPVFGIVHLATVATSPFVGPLVSRLGLRRVFTLGVVCLSVASMGFGLLDFINQTILFLILAYILRWVVQLCFSSVDELLILFLSSSYNKMLGINPCLRLMEGISGALLWPAMLSPLLARSSRKHHNT